jgi:hypothetical protein
VSKRAPKSIEDVRAAFETRTVLQASRAELEEMLVALSSANIEDAAMRAHARGMGETLRQLLDNRRVDELRRPSKLALVAVVLASVALLGSAMQAYHVWPNWQRRSNSTMASAEQLAMQVDTGATQDLRTNLTIAELAKRAPSLRTGNLQAWWAGEQARMVQRLEAQAKRQALAGDREGAARSASRADAIRSRIPALVDYEKPASR